MTYGAGMLLGREEEQRQLDQLLRKARAGNSGVLLLRGEAGIGKTALLDYAASRAGGMTVLRATGVESEAGLPFGGLYALLSPVTQHISALPSQQAAALREALGLDSGPAAAGRLAIAAGTHAVLTVAAAAQPLVLLADDLHWLDPASADALLFAVRRFGDDAVACVLAARPGVPALAGLPAHDLTGLQRAEVRRLAEVVTGIRPTAAVAERLDAETGGNPLAVLELAGSMTAAQLGGADLPEMPLAPGAGVRQGFADRLGRLDPEVRTTLLVAAAAGRCAVADVTAAAKLLGGGEALTAAEEALLVRVTPDGVEFSHPLVRSVAYHAAMPAERRAAHRALADVLGRRDTDRAAWHLAAAATGPDDTAAACLDAAAIRAARRSAPLAAAAAWERAADLSGEEDARDERLLLAAEAALSGGDLERADRLARAAPAAALPAPRRARLLAARGHVDLLRGHMAAAQRALADAAGLAEGDNLGLAVGLLAESVGAAIEAGLLEEAASASARLVALADPGDGIIQFQADLACGSVAWHRGDPEHGMVLLRRAAARLDADPAIAASPERQLDVVSAWTNVGHPERACLYAERAVDLARGEGALGRLPDALAYAVWCYHAAGRWSLALALGSQAVQLAQAAGQDYQACQLLTIMASIEAAQGRGDDCRQHAREADKVAGELGLHPQQLLARRHLALLDLGEGRLEEAIARYEALRQLAADWGVSHPYYSPVQDLIEAYCRAGALERARALLPEFIALVPGEANPVPAARAERCTGLLAENDFEAHFLRALALNAQGITFEQARTHLCYGERLRRARRRRDARHQLRAAAEIFDRLDARPWAERARAELQASGEKVERGPSNERLTPQELQIAMLVSQGRTNAEVGRAVFLSTRTVEFHLSRAYRKLGVASRTELTRRLLSMA